MELRHLRYFVAVAEELSFTRAAGRLHIAQPPLSQQVRALEEELGCVLFERGARRVLLTGAGRELLPEARQVLEAVERLREHAARTGRGEGGSLSVALVSALATPRFAAMLREFQERHPGVRLSLGDHPSVWQLEALDRGELDAGFLRPPARLPAHLEAVVLRHERMRLAVPSTHPLATRGRAAWKDLRGEPLILVEASVAAADYYSAFFDRCRAAGVEPLVRQTTRNVATQIWLVSAGLGLAPLPNAPDLDERYPGLALVDLPPDAPVGELALVWRRADPSPALRAFVAVAREVLGARSPRGRRGD